MSVTVSPAIYSKPRIKTFTVIASADADTTATFAHGMASAPDFVTITPLQQASAALSAWAVTTIDATNVVLTKSTATGSLNAGVQILVKVELLHSIVS